MLALLVRYILLCQEEGWCGLDESGDFVQQNCYLYRKPLTLEYFSLRWNLVSSIAWISKRDTGLCEHFGVGQYDPGSLQRSKIMKILLPLKSKDHIEYGA